MSRAARAYVADVERKAPQLVRKPLPANTRQAFNLHVNRSVYQTKDKVKQLTDGATAFDARVLNKNGERPLKPPPLPHNMPERQRPGERNLPRQRLTAPAMRWTGEGWKY